MSLHAHKKIHNQVYRMSPLVKEPLRKTPYALSDKKKTSVDKSFTRQMGKDFYKGMSNYENMKSLIFGANQIYDRPFFRNKAIQPTRYLESFKIDPVKAKDFILNNISDCTEIVEYGAFNEQIELYLKREYILSKQMTSYDYATKVGVKNGYTIELNPSLVSCNIISIPNPSEFSVGEKVALKSLDFISKPLNDYKQKLIEAFNKQARDRLRMLKGDDSLDDIVSLDNFHDQVQNITPLDSEYSFVTINGNIYNYSLDANGNVDESSEEKYNIEIGFKIANTALNLVDEFVNDSNTLWVKYKNSNGVMKIRHISFSLDDITNVSDKKYRLSQDLKWKAHHYEGVSGKLWKLAMKQDGFISISKPQLEYNQKKQLKESLERAKAKGEKLSEVEEDFLEENKDLESDKVKKEYKGKLKKIREEDDSKVELEKTLPHDQKLKDPIDDLQRFFRYSEGLVKDIVENEDVLEFSTQMICTLVPFLRKDIRENKRWQLFLWGFFRFFDSICKFGDDMELAKVHNFRVTPSGRNVLDGYPRYRIKAIKKNYKADKIEHPCFISSEAGLSNPCLYLQRPDFSKSTSSERVKGVFHRVNQWVLDLDVFFNYKSSYTSKGRYNYYFLDEEAIKQWKGIKKDKEFDKKQEEARKKMFIESFIRKEMFGGATKEEAEIKAEIAWQKKLKQEANQPQGPVDKQKEKERLQNSLLNPTLLSKDRKELKKIDISIWENSIEEFISYKKNFTCSFLVATKEEASAYELTTGQKWFNDGTKGISKVECFNYGYAKDSKGNELLDEPITNPVSFTLDEFEANYGSLKEQQKLALLVEQIHKPKKAKLGAWDKATNKSVTTEDFIVEELGDDELNHCAYPFIDSNGIPRPYHWEAFSEAKHMKDSDSLYSTDYQQAYYLPMPLDLWYRVPYVAKLEVHPMMMYSWYHYEVTTKKAYWWAKVLGVVLVVVGIVGMYYDQWWSGLAFSTGIKLLQATQILPNDSIFNTFVAIVSIAMGGGFDYQGLVNGGMSGTTAGLVVAANVASVANTMYGAYTNLSLEQEAKKYQTRIDELDKQTKELKDQVDETWGNGGVNLTAYDVVGDNGSEIERMYRLLAGENLFGDSIYQAYFSSDGVYNDYERFKN
ncbi:MAG: hypothetical protein KGV46_01600 [Pasteurella sp.]|nr:hypothetical protein [Pasteurella sp.]